MHMCVAAISSVVIIVVAITAIGFGIGKLNRFGDSNEIIEIEEEKQNEYNTNMDDLYYSGNGVFYDSLRSVEQNGKEKKYEFPGKIRQ